MVQEGEVDLALIPTRVFDTMGISGFEALQTPLLIDTAELAGAVAASDVATTMLTGLGDHGLVGLGLIFEGLRRPMALNGAVDQASDFEGLLVRVPASNVSDRVFEALGAVPDHGEDHLVATNGEPYPLVETELELADTEFAPGSTVTSGLVLFPKYGALLADPDALDDLERRSGGRPPRGRRGHRRCGRADHGRRGGPGRDLLRGRGRCRRGSCSRAPLDRAAAHDRRRRAA